MRLKSLAIVCAVSALLGCGVIYQTSTVRDAAGDGDGVRIVDISPEVVQRANASPYQPSSLPEAFSRIAGAASPNLNAPLPEPVFDPEQRPNAVELRLPPEADPGPYRIGIGDVLLLATPQGPETVEDLAGGVATPSQRQRFMVQDDGALSVPQVGRVVVSGLTLEAAEDVLFDRLIEARLDPTFSLEIAEFNSQRVTIGGSINAPGVVPLTLSPLFLDGAIAGAGGFSVPVTEFSVIRIYRNGSLFQIPVTELYSDEGVRRIRLLDGDSIFVDTEYDLDRAQAFFEEQIDRAEFTRAARAAAITELSTEINLRRAALTESRENFRAQVEFGAADQKYVYVAGEVGQLGRFELPFDNRATVADALFDAGGLLARTADPSQIYVLRAESSSVPDEFVTAYRLDTRNAANYFLATQMELRPGDVIFVAPQPVTQWNRVVTQLIPSLSAANVADTVTRN
ncbi:MAG: polysaccharide biosynthesis/export family protein [Pseudomonadota bacterium]